VAPAPTAPGQVSFLGNPTSAAGIALDRLAVNWYITQVVNQWTDEGWGRLREMAGLDEGAPLFAQVAERLATEIADGGLAEGEQVPSGNELAGYYRINPATAAKGINVLADEGLLEKRRGIGMFVAAGARRRLLEQRRRLFAERFVQPLVTEAGRLGIDTDDLVDLIRTSSHAQGGMTV
jgi:DNA-binding transcriptional regulator YhcF (GntR family)